MRSPVQTPFTSIRLGVKEVFFEELAGGIFGNEIVCIITGVVTGRF